MLGFNVEFRPAGRFRPHGKMNVYENVIQVHLTVLQIKTMIIVKKARVKKSKNVKVTEHEYQCNSSVVEPSLSGKKLSLQ